MYKCLFVLLALTSGSLCQENVNLTDTLQNIDNLYDGAKPVERFTRQGTSRNSESFWIIVSRDEEGHEG